MGPSRFIRSPFISAIHIRETARMNHFSGATFFGTIFPLSMQFVD